MNLTDAEVARVMAAPKTVTQQIKWREKPGKTHKSECEFAVRIPDEHNPDLATLGRIEATINPYKTKFAFIYEGVCIRRWESKGPHKNPDQQWIRGEHKHEWNETDEDRFAYVPDDINSTDRNTILETFLKECEIEIGGAGSYAAVLPGFGGDQ